MNMWVQFKWTLDKGFWRSASLTKHTNDRHPFNSGTKLLVFQYLWTAQSEIYWKSASGKRYLELLIDILPFFSWEVSEKITHCTKNLVMSNLADRLKTGCFSKCQPLSLLILPRMKVLLFFFKNSEKLLQYEWLRKFHHRFL